MSERVFVTGLGAVTPIGLGFERFWKNLCDGTAAFSKIPPVYPAMKPDFCAGLLSSHDKAKIFAETPIKRTVTAGCPPDSSLYAVHAAREALQFAGLKPGSQQLRKSLVVLGNNEAQADLIDERVEDNFSRWGKQTYSGYSVADDVASFAGSIGPAFVIHNTCASGNVALEFALRALRRGDFDVAIVGGADVFSKKVWSGFVTLGALGTDWCRPFSKNRRFITIAEGAAVLVLQSESSLRPGQHRIAELVSVASNNDALHPTNPDLSSVSSCHDLVLERANLKAHDIDLIFAHGTGTRSNDAVEASIFGARYPDATVTAIKGTTGHLMATAGALGAVASCLSLQYQKIPPTLISQDELEYPIGLATFDRNVEKPLTYVQNNAFGFGGNNAISIFRKVE